MDQLTPTKFKEKASELVTQGKYCRVQYFSALHEFFTVRAVLKAIQTEAKEDVLVLSSGENIPLSRIYRLDDYVNPAYQDYYNASCDI